MVYEVTIKIFSHILVKISFPVWFFILFIFHSQEMFQIIEILLISPFYKWAPSIGVIDTRVDYDSWYFISFWEFNPESNSLPGTFEMD